MLAPTPYVADHPISRTIMAAVAAGLNKPLRPASHTAWHPAPAVSYGVLRGTSDIFNRNYHAQIDWWHLDIGYWGRGHYDGYYRLSFNSTQQPHPSVLEKTQPRIPLPTTNPLKCGNGPIVVCPPTLLYSVNNPLYHINQTAWEDAVCRRLSTLTNVPFTVRRKEETGNEPFPPDPYCVVVYNSNVAIEALIRGTPAISTAPGIVKDMCPTLAMVENQKVLEIDNRESLFKRLSWAQYTLEEFRTGLPWKHYS